MKNTSQLFWCKRDLEDEVVQTGRYGKFCTTTADGSV